MYEVDRTATFKGTLYQVLQVLDNELLLVVKKEDAESGEYPLEIVVIPDEEMIEARKEMRK